MLIDKQFLASRGARTILTVYIITFTSLTKAELIDRIEGSALIQLVLDLESKPQLEGVK